MADHDHAPINLRVTTHPTRAKAFTYGEQALVKVGGQWRALPYQGHRGDRLVFADGSFEVAVQPDELMSRLA